MSRLLLIVDDDALSREVLALLAEEAGFAHAALDSGEAALAYLALHPAEPPSAMLIDMQMPGLAGDPLAQRLRAAAPRALLVAMSGTAVPPAQRRHFDRFLLKPFDFPAFLAVLDEAPPAAASIPPPASSDILSEATFEALMQNMSPTQLDGLFTMLFADADRRIVIMRAAQAAGDADAYCRAAHAIKGGCAMVGALELASIADAMEQDGPASHKILVDQFDPFAHFAAAAARLRSILGTRLHSDIE